MSTNRQELITRFLLRKQINRATLAKNIGISEAGLSKIYHGRSKPRRDTLHRMIECLVTDSTEANEVWRTFYDEPFPATKLPVASSKMSSNTGYAKGVAFALSFKDEARRLLENAGLNYRYSEEGVVDFLVTLKVKIGVECLTDMGSSWSRRLAIAHVLREHVGADRWVICVPEPLMPSEATVERFAAELVPIVTPGKLVDTLNSLSDHARAVLQVSPAVNQLLQDLAKKKGTTVEALLEQKFSPPLEVEELPPPLPREDSVVK